MADDERADPDVVRERSTTEMVQPGDVWSSGVPYWDFGDVGVIIVGSETAIYREWGVDVTGSHELVVDGDLCLIPAPADPELS